MARQKLTARTRPKGGLPPVHSVMPKQPVKYARLSLDKEGRQQGVARQLSECDAAALELGWPAPEALADNSASAMKQGNRPAFTKLLAGLRDGTYDGVLVNFQDRLLRNDADMSTILDLFRELKSYGVVVPIYSTEEGYIDLYTARGVKQFMDSATAALYEINRKGERTVIKHRQSASQAKAAPGGPRPFGYLHSSCPNLAEMRRYFDSGMSPNIKGLVLSEGLFAKVQGERHLYTELMARLLRGENLNAIAVDWNARGEVTTQGCRWDHNAIGEKARSPRQAGLRIYEQEVHEGSWEALIDRATWEAVQRQLDRNPGVRHAAGAPYLLHGLVYGPDGDHTPRGNMQHGERRYLGAGVNVIEEDLDEIVLDAVFALTRDKAILAPGQAALDRRELLAEIERLEGQLRRQRATFDADDSYDAEDFDRLTRKPRLALADARRRLGAMEAHDTEWTDILSEAGALEANWDKLSIHVQRAAMRFLIERVEIAKATTRGRFARLKFHRGRVHIVWRNTVLQ